MTKLTDGDGRPTIDSLIESQIAVDGNWQAIPWWLDFAPERPLAREQIRSAFEGLAAVFTSDWAHARVVDGRPHWFLHAIKIPMLHVLEDLVSLGLALASVRSASSTAWNHFVCNLRKQPNRSGLLFEVRAAGFFAGRTPHLKPEPKGKRPKVLDLGVDLDELPMLAEMKALSSGQDERSCHGSLNLLTQKVDFPTSRRGWRYIRATLSPEVADRLGELYASADRGELETRTTSLAQRIGEAVMSHDPEGYGHSAFEEFEVDSWPREEGVDGFQLHVRGTIADSDHTARRIFENLVDDAAQKFESGATGVVLVALDHPIDLRAFAARWATAQLLEKYRPIAAIAIVSRSYPDGSGPNFDAWSTDLFRNELHPQALAVSSRLSAALTRLPSETGGLSVVADGPEPGPARAWQNCVVAFGGIVLGPGEQASFTITPLAEPPAELVERYQARVSRAPID